MKSPGTGNRWKKGKGYSTSTRFCRWVNHYMASTVLLYHNTKECYYSECGHPLYHLGKSVGMLSDGRCVDLNSSTIAMARGLKRQIQSRDARTQNTQPRQAVTRPGLTDGTKGPASSIPTSFVPQEICVQRVQTNGQQSDIASGSISARHINPNTSSRVSSPTPLTI